MENYNSPLNKEDISQKFELYLFLESKENINTQSMNVLLKIDSIYDLIKKEIELLMNML